MSEDALWTTIYSDMEIRLIEEYDQLDKNEQKQIDLLISLVEE